MAASTWKSFAIDDESPTLLARYGDNRLGRSCLVARRLVEAGVSLITVIFGGWDTHSHHLEHTRDRLLPPLNPGSVWRRCCDDLADRGLLDSTLVAWTGEFGRTPVINGNSPPGRDHWATVYSTVLAGGGVRGGQVYGKSDKLAAEPVDNPVPVADYVATIYHALGYDADTTVVDPLNRPHQYPGRSDRYWVCSENSMAITGFRQRLPYGSLKKFRLNWTVVPSMQTYDGGRR